ncbi:MAG: hypothetical protein WA117_19180 [Verrucomicrobiia bacterium]
MSMNFLANAAIARRLDFAPLNTVPQNLAEIAAASSKMPFAITLGRASQPLAETAASIAQLRLAGPAAPSTQAAPAAPPASAQPSGTAQSPAAAQANAMDTAMHVIFGYIPTEILTLYVPTVAALHESHATSKLEAASPGEWIAFWVFLAATPVVTWVLYATKVKAESKPVPWCPQQWPIWEMIAGTIAFFVWAFALSNNPFSMDYKSWYSAGISGIAVLVASTCLGLLAPLFQRPIKPAAAPANPISASPSVPLKP